MAPTSEVRREVAARLRGPFDVCECVGHTYISGTLYGMQVCARDELALRDGMRHLADLIDPTCHFLPSPDGGFGCDRCCTWFPDMETKPNLCPSCDARVVSGDGLD